jgi:hypothetical protein
MLMVAAVGCDSRGPVSRAGAVSPIPRRTVVWLDEQGVDETTAAQLQRAGVDELVVPRGTVNLAGGSPVLNLIQAPPVAGSIPVAISLRVQGLRPNLEKTVAADVWRAIAAEMGEATPAEIVLDMPDVAPGVADFLDRLSKEAGVPVVPVLTAEQIRSPEAVRAAAVARVCVIPVFGTGHASVRGIGEMAALSLVEKLEPLAAEGVRIRLAISLQPLTVPELSGWGEDLNPLSEPETATVSTSSVLDRSFVFNQPVEWSGRQWQPGETVAVRWLDVSRLHGAFGEMNRLILPELGGWDLVPLPPEGRRLGMGREALIRYLGGEGPHPEVALGAERNGSRITVSLANTSPFTSAVSAVGNWVEFTVDAGSLIAEGRGSFDRLVLGTKAGGQWRPRFFGAPTAVRFHELYLGPGEELQTGSIRLSPRNAEYRVSWHIVLSSGEEFTGALQR